MKKQQFTSYLALPVAALLLMGTMACNSQKKSNNEEATEEVAEVTVTPIDHAQAFPEAKLVVSQIAAVKGEGDKINLDVKYDVTGFTLTDQTEMKHEECLANSHDGQHIHFILDNQPYVALYEPANVAEVAKGEHYLMSFLSRSYHESIKSPDAYVLKHFEIDDNGKYKELPLGENSMLFYSRPKGEYKGDETKELLLDFYLVNCNLSEGYKVVCDIDGKTFDLNEWRPYVIRGLELGKHIVTLTLVDANGTAVEGTDGTVSREITLSE